MSEVYEQKLKDLLLLAARQNASDLHLAVGRRPTLRIDGNLIPVQQEQILTPEATAGLSMTLLTPDQQAYLAKNKEVDFAYSFEDKARFRVNVYMQRGFFAAALRLIPSKIRTIEELNLPPILHDFTRLAQGFVLVVGP